LWKFDGRRWRWKVYGERAGRRAGDAVGCSAIFSPSTEHSSFEGVGVSDALPTHALQSAHLQRPPICPHGPTTVAPWSRRAVAPAALVKTPSRPRVHRVLHGRRSPYPATHGVKAATRCVGRTRPCLGLSPQLSDTVIALPSTPAAPPLQSC